MPPNRPGSWDPWVRTLPGGIDRNNCEQGPGIWLWRKRMCRGAPKPAQVTVGAGLLGLWRPIQVITINFWAMKYPALIERNPVPAYTRGLGTERIRAPQLMAVEKRWDSGEKFSLERGRREREREEEDRGKDKGREREVNGERGSNLEFIQT